MNIEITPRDRQIFKFIYENSFASTQQIHKAIFSNRHLATTKNRLTRLALGSYLTKVRGKRLVYRLTKKALQEILFEDENIARYQRKGIIMSQFLHDSEVIDCKILFMNSKIITDWVPVHRLLHLYNYSENNKIKAPDAVFTLMVEGKPLKVALELEMTQKNKKRYLNLLEKYYTKLPVDLIFYIVRPENLKKTLLEIGKSKLKELAQRRVTAQNKLYVTTLDEFKKQGLDAVFQGTTGKSFSLKELETRGHQTQSLPQS